MSVGQGPVNKDWTVNSGPVEPVLANWISALPVAIVYSLFTKTGIHYPVKDHQSSSMPAALKAGMVLPSRGHLATSGNILGYGRLWLASGGGPGPC